MSKLQTRNAFSNTSLQDTDLFWIEVDLGGGTFESQKITGLQLKTILSQDPIVNDVVLIDQNTPTTDGVTFNPNTPLTQDILYLSTTNGSTWIYNGSAYVTYVMPVTSTTPFNLYGSSVDAGGNKTTSIQRTGDIYVGTNSLNSIVSSSTGLAHTSNGFSQVFSTTYSNSEYPIIRQTRRRGTQASNTPAQNGDILGTHSFNSNGDAASISVKATETHGLTTRGSEIILSNCANGTASQVENLKIQQDGKLKVSNAYTLPSTAPTSGQVLGYSSAGVSDWQTISAGGIWGIANSSGIYTYYTTYALARASATSGQTIELFADVTETTDVSIILKDGVNINGNGHTYILSQASTSSTITDNAVSCVCDVSNIIFKRSGGTPSTTNTATILLSGASKITGTAICYSSCGVSILITNASAELNGFKGVTTTNYHGVYSNGILKNVYGETNSSGYHYSIYSSGTSVNCHGLGFGLYQSAFYNFGGIATNCSGTVTGSFGGGFANSGIATNCSGKAVGNYGFSSSGTAINCTGTSTSGNGFSANGSGNILEKCSGYSSSAYGFSVYGSRVIDCTGVSMSSIGLAVSNGNDSQAGCINCTGVSYGNIGMSCNFTPNNYGVVNPKALSYYNNASGHALQIGSFGNTVISGYFAVANTSANCINSASVISTKIAKNTYVGSTTPVNANITQTMVNTQDSYGNILI
jgi:hypothetical protein